ncbi:hypothetical protein EJC49_02365 [Aquibium carbonis]|uniref:DUF1127 domain-containing protein n=1 Tax=Aquibium carbonis TaxID=2495581 RepID=A0A3R9YHP9_9HYPH|nr:hypothetical protein [Aquibium carbonis]RST88004.1 hypothetical protein EJC49_02365 [Aquibium carbonis]
MPTRISRYPAKLATLWIRIAPLLARRRPRRPSLATKLDKRLLDDVGLTEEDVLGVEGRYWREWERSQRSWNL